MTDRLKNILTGTIKLILLGLFWSIGTGKGYGQTNGDLELSYTDTLVCIADTNQVQKTLNFSNNSLQDARFAGGTFTIDWGDGTTDVWPQGELSLSHPYQKKGRFELVLKWEKGTTVLQRAFPLHIKQAPVASIWVPSSGQCVGMETVFQVLKYEENQDSPETKYYLEYKGHVLHEFTQEKIEKVEGKIVHRFNETLCSEDILLRVTNQCTEAGLVTEDVGMIKKPLSIVHPIEIDFNIDPIPVCTELPFTITPVKEKVGECIPKINYTWTLTTPSGAEKRYYGDTPNLPPFTEKGKYKMELWSEVPGYTCASDTTIKPFQVIERVKVDFTMDADTVCYVGTPLTLHFDNLSSGDSILAGIWSVNGENRQQNRDIRDFECEITAPGDYRVTYELMNSCSSDKKDTVVTVKQNPEISKWELPDTLCGGTLQLTEAMVGYAWNWDGNPQRAHWTVTDPHGNLLPLSNDLYPAFSLTISGKYLVELRLEDAGCGPPSAKSHEIWVVDPTITGDLTAHTAAVRDTIFICTGGTLEFTNTYAGDGLYSRWSIEKTGPFAGSLQVEYAGGTSATSATPVFKFGGYGDCVLKNETGVRHHCNSVTKTFKVHVKKDPEVNFLAPEGKICPQDNLDFRDGSVSYSWFNNIPAVHWTFTPANVDFLEGTTAEDLYPKVHFRESGVTYQVKVEAISAGCPAAPEDGVAREATAEVYVRRSALSSEISHSDLSICEGQRVTFRNRADDPEKYLKYTWTIDPVKEGTENITAPDSSLYQVRFQEWGTYRVTGKVESYCDDTTYQPLVVTVYKNPSVTIKDDTVCPGKILLGSYVEYHWYNNDSSVVWTINRPAEDYEIEDAAALRPWIWLKKAGDYELTATLRSAAPCSASAPELSATGKFHVYDTAITGSLSLQGMGTVTDAGDICEGETITFNNTVTAEKGLDWEWWVSGPTEEYVFDNGTKTSQQEVPTLTFNRYGDYTVHVKATAICSERVWHFPVTVRGIPEVTLPARLSKICAGDEIDFGQAYLVYGDVKNNPLTYKWTVTSPESVTTLPTVSPSDAEAAPVIHFHENGHYRIELEAFSKCVAGGSRTFPTEIDVIRREVKAIFEVKDSAVCTPFAIELKNRSDGDSLTYRWEVEPEFGDAAGSWEWIEPGGPFSESPSVSVRQFGYYRVRLTASNETCNTWDDSVSRIRVYSSPGVTISPVSSVCEPFTFEGADRILLEDHNDPIRQVEWNIVSLASYDPFDETLYKPDIVFHGGDFQVTVKYWNKCSLPGEAVFTVKVDTFIPIDFIPDTSICVKTEPLLLKASPEGGWWTSDAGGIAPGSSYFHPDFDPYTEQDIEVYYHFKNGACQDDRRKNIHLWPLPHVTTHQKVFDMCINHDPRVLDGQEPLGGWWMYGNDTLKEDKFAPWEAGDFSVKYYFAESLHGCINRDSSVMKVHPLPITVFHTDPLHCRDSVVWFYPEQPEDTFLWNFGDAFLRAPGNASHVYPDYGDKKVSAVVTSIFGCVDKSDTLSIEIVNQAPPAFFGIDSVFGCDPYKAVFRVDTSVYRENHNHLSFFWDYGDGTTSDTIRPVFEKPYPGGLWDTTFNVHFTVNNMCNSSTWDTTIRVFSLPVAGFKLAHDWECSPVVLELQNTSTGNGCTFAWDLGDGTRDTVRNPTHEYKEVPKATFYRIVLQATNRCKTDTHIDSLLVKPKTISAHFTPAKRFVCVDEELCFTNNSTDTLGIIQLTAWDFGDGVRDTLWDICHPYKKEGEYTVGLYIHNGCGWDTITDRIQVFPLPVLSVVGQPTLCEDDTLSVGIRSDMELKRVSWDFGDGHTDTGDSVAYVYEGYGLREVVAVGVAKNLPGCADTARHEVEIYNKPIVTILPLDTAHCSPLFYQPEITGDGFFLWDYGEGGPPTSFEGHLYENPEDTVQRFKVVAHVETDKGCKEDFFRTVAIYPVPRAAIGKEVIAGKPERVIFKDLSEENDDCIWHLPFGGEVHSLEDQEVAFDRNGTYSVTLVALNKYGCGDTTFLEHEVLMKGLYFPNTFIPHSSNPKVNRFNGIGIGLKVYTLEIYDQYGNKIWETHALQDGSPSEGWDGRNVEGKLMPQGVYIWRARAIFADENVWTGKNNASGVEQTVQGSVLMLRE